MLLCVIGSIALWIMRRRMALGSDTGPVLVSAGRFADQQHPSGDWNGFCRAAALLPLGGVLPGGRGAGFSRLGTEVPRWGRCRFPARPRQSCVVSLLGVGTLSALTLARNPVWTSDLALFTDTVDKAPRNVKARLWLGDSLVRSGDLTAAMGQYRKALEIYPDYAPAAANLVVPLKSLGRLQEAIDTGERARALFGKRIRGCFTTWPSPTSRPASRCLFSTTWDE